MARDNSPSPQASGDATGGRPASARPRSPKARRLIRRPAWAAALAGAFLAGIAIGPIEASAQPSVSHAAGGTTASAPGTTASAARFPHLGHIFVIMMENSAYSQLLSPANTNTRYIQQLATTDGLATDYYGVTHTSLPNYIAATSGSNWGSNTDDDNQTPYFNHENLVDELEAAHVSWKGYMQSLPYAGDTVDISANGLYVRKHDPFLLYPDVYNNPVRARTVVPLSQLRTDLATGHVPAFSWISPNVCDDMHGGAAACPYASSPASPAQATLYADGNAFIKKWVGLITHSMAWAGHSAIFITWDEGAYNDNPPYQPLDLAGGPDSPVLPATPVNPSTGSGGDLVGGTTYGGGHVPMIVIARGVGHKVDATPADHYSLLRTIEENWGLPLLGNAGDSVQVRSLAALLQPNGHGR